MTSAEGRRESSVIDPLLDQNKSVNDATLKFVGWMESAGWL
jgi:hypothetical protein